MVDLLRPTLEKKQGTWKRMRRQCFSVGSQRDMLLPAVAIVAVLAKRSWRFLVRMHALKAVAGLII